MAVKTSNQVETKIRKVTLCGIKPIMFDRYAGDNNTKLESWQKLYFKPGTKTLVMPSSNIISFLSAHNTNSAPKRLRDSRTFKKIANACLSFVNIAEDLIPFTKDGKPIEFGQLDVVDGIEIDKKSGVYIHSAVARLDKGIPNPKKRPVLPCPWELNFTLELYPTREIQEQEILNLFEEGGRALGLGTFRGVFGKFIVKKWD